MVKQNTDSVVVGIDGTNGSAGALRYAVHQARHRRCGLSLVHVGPRYEVTSPVIPYVPTQVDEAGLALLKAAQDEVAMLDPDLAVTTELKSGSRISALTHVADRGEMLVLGRETRTGLERLVFGATTAAVAARSAVPITVVPHDWRPGPTPGQVVVGLRTAEHSAELFEAAFAHAVATGASLEVVHAWDLPDAYSNLIEARTHDREWVEAGTRFIEHELDGWRDLHPDLRVTVRVVHDRPSRAILAAAAEAELVVLVRRSVPRHFGAHLGSTARAVLRAAVCPVLIVPPQPSEAESFNLEIERSGEMLR